MQRSIVYFLLVIFLFVSVVPGQTLEELTRLPVLWQHFQVHKSQYPETSFGDYFQMHYGKGFAQHHSAHDHSKLPMKSGDKHLHAPALVDAPKPAEINFQAIFFDSEPVRFKDQLRLQSFLTDIWQPPRSC